MWGWCKKSCDDPRAALESRFLFPGCWMSLQLQYTIFLANAVQGETVRFFLYCADNHPPLPAERRNTLWKFEGVYVKKEGKQQHIQRPRQSHKHLVPSTGGEHSLLCLQLWCSWRGWCWENPGALRVLFTSVGPQTLEHSLPANPIALMLDNKESLQQQHFVTVCHIWQQAELTSRSSRSCQAGAEHQLMPTAGKQSLKPWAGARFSPLELLTILTRRLLFIKELAVYVTVNLSGCRPVLRCAAHTACPSDLCWAAQVSWPQHKLSRVTVTEQPAGSSHLVLSITPPVWPCSLSWSGAASSHVNIGCLRVEMMNTIVFV